MVVYGKRAIKNQLGSCLSDLVGAHRVLTTTFVVTHCLHEPVELPPSEYIDATNLSIEVTLEALKHWLHLLTVVAVVRVELDQVRSVLVW